MKRAIIICLIAVAILAIVAVVTPAAEAVNRTWTGSTNTAWSNSNNWDPTGVPTSSDNVFIPNVSDDPVISVSASTAYLQVNDSAVLTVDGGTLNVTGEMMTDTNSVLDLTNNATVVHLHGNVHIWGVVNCTGTSPTIHCYDSFSVHHNFISGYSTIYAEGSGNHYFYQGGSTKDFHDFVVNGSSTRARMTATRTVIGNDLTVADGTIDLWNRETLVRGDMNVSGELELTHSSDNLIVKGDLFFQNGSTTDVTTGIIACQGEWYVWDTAQMQLGGDNEAIMNGSFGGWYSIEFHSPDSHFNNLSIERVFGEVELVTGEPVNVTGHLVVDQATQSQDFDVYHGELVVWENVTVRTGTFSFWGAGQADVHGDMFVDGGCTVEFRNDGDLNVHTDFTFEGTLSFNHASGGTMSVGGGTFVQNGGRIVYSSGFGEFLADGTVYINASCSLSLTSGTAYFNQTSSDNFYVYGDVDLRHDGARLNVGTMWIVMGGHVNCYDHKPQITLTNNWYNGGTFTPGNSTVTFLGHYSYTYTDDVFWNVIVDKDWRLRFGDSMRVSGTLLIVGGELELFGHTLTVNGNGLATYMTTDYGGFVNLAGELIMQDPTDHLEVRADVLWGSSSTATVDNGTINCTGNWTFASGSTVNLTGRNTVHMNGSITGIGTGNVHRYVWCNSTGASFNHLRVTSWGTPFGDVHYTHVGGSEALVVDGDLEKSGRYSHLMMGSSTSEVWGATNVTQGCLWLDDACTMDMYGDLFILDDSGGVPDDGTVRIGHNVSWTGGGMLHVRGRVYDTGNLWFFGLGGNLTVDDYITIASPGELALLGEAGNITADSIFKEMSSSFRIYPNETTIDVADLVINSSMVVGKRRRPTFLISDDLLWANVLSVEMGHSQVRLDGVGNQTLDAAIDYWGVVIDKPSGEANFDDDAYAESYFAVHRGGFDLWGRNVTVDGTGPSDHGYWANGGYRRGFILEDAEFNMTKAAGHLFSTYMWFFSGSRGTLTDGEVHLDLNLYAMSGAEVNMSGTHTYIAQSGSTSVYIYSSDFSFSDVTVMKPTGRVVNIGSQYTAPMVVKGDLTIHNDGYNDNVNVQGDVFVTGDVTVIEGVLHLYGGTQTTVKGDMSVIGDGTCRFGHDLGGGNLDVSGYLGLMGYGMHFNYTGGNVTVGGTTWIDSILGFNATNGNVTTFSTHEIRVNATGTLYVGSNETYITTALDVTYAGDIRIHDQANPRFVVHDDWNANGGDFKSGRSEVWIEGSGNQYLDLERYWIVVINKTSGYSYCTNDGLTVKSCLFIVNGTYDTFGYTTYVNGSSPGFLFNGTYYTGFVNYGGELRMTSTDDVLDVNGPVVWGPGSTDDIQDGAFYSNGSWVFRAGSEATLDNITVVFDGNNQDTYFNWATMQSHSNMSYFTDIEVSRDTGMGIVLDWPSTEPLVVKGDVECSSNFAVVHTDMNVTGLWDQTAGTLLSDAEFSSPYGPAVLTIGRDLYVQAGASLAFVGNFENIIVECQDLEINGSMSVGTGAVYQKWLNVSGSSVIRGSASIGGSGSWNTGGTLTIATGSDVSMSNVRYHINATGTIILQSGSTTDLFSNGGHLRAGAYFSLFGELNCTGYSPMIHVGADWTSIAGAEFIPGYSTVFFEATGVDVGIDHTPRFHDVVVDTGLRTVTIDMNVSVNKLHIESGTLHLDTYDLYVRSDLNALGTLNIDGDVELGVGGSAYFDPGSTVSASNGTCVISGDLTVEDGTDVDMSGALLKFNSSQSSYWKNHDAGSSYGNVQVNKSQWAYTYLSAAPVYVNGDLTIYAKGTSFGLAVQNSTLVVSGNLRVDRGKLLVPYGNVSVNATIAVADGAFVVVSSDGNVTTKSLVVEGTLYLNGTGSVLTVTGSVELPGSDIIFSGHESYMYVDGDLFVNGSAVVNMTGIQGLYTLEVNGTFDLYGLLNMTNDKSTLVCHDALNIWPTYGGMLYVGGTTEPDIHLRESFNGLGPASAFVPGHSVIHLFGPDYQTLEDDFDYWGIVINKTGSTARFEGTGAVTPHIESFLFLENGTFNLEDSSVMVNSSGSGHYHDGSWYTGFANHGGYFVQTDDNGTLDVNGPVHWGPASTEQVTAGHIYVSDSWNIDSGALMTFTDTHHVHFDGSTSAMFYGHASGAQFRNVTVQKDPTHVLTFGGGVMNVTDTLTVDSPKGIDVSDHRLEVSEVVHDDGELNVSGSSGELHVWDVLAMDSTATLWIADDAHAFVQDFIGMGTIWLGNGTNLTVADDLYMTLGTLHPGRSIVYLTDQYSSSIRIGGRFHDLMVDKGSFNQATLGSDTTIDGDLTILNGHFYPGTNDIHLGGDFTCTPSAWFAPPSTDAGTLYLEGGTDQYMSTGGDNGNHDIVNLTIAGSGTTVHVVDYPLKVTDTLRINSTAELRFEADNETLYTGPGGVFNNGTLRVHSDTGPIDVEIYAGSDVINNGTMQFVDSSWTRALHLYSSSPGTQWNLVDNSGSDTNPQVYHVNVSDSDASGGNTIYAGTGYNHDDGNNVNWVFSHRVNIWFHDNDNLSMNLTVHRYGNPVTISGTLGVWDWADEDSTATLQDEYVVTSNEERYYTEDTTQWTVTGEVNAHVYYYRQWKPDITLDGTDASHTVTAYYTSLDGDTTQSGQHTSWSRWVDNGSSLSFDKEASGTPTRHTSEDFTVAPWDPLTSALVRTVTYAGNEIPELYNGSMDPSGGNVTTVFNFTVEYWDANNDAPLFVYVNIDGTNHSMDKVDPGDTDYTDGAEFYYETLLSGGDHDYHFICNDTYVTNETAVENTGTIIPEFGLLPVMLSVMGVCIAVAWRRRRRR